MKFDLQAFHLVLTLHDSRVSSRMQKFGIKNKSTLKLSLDEEIALSRIIKSIFLEYSIRCLAYNSCVDHIHLLLVCRSNELNGIVKKIKGKSSYLFNKTWNRTGSLWSQKYFWRAIDEYSLGLRNIDGSGSNNYLGNCISYISVNREKHGYKNSIELQNVIDEMVIRIQEAYDLE